MGKDSGQIRAYSAADLEIMGCGHSTKIRKRYSHLSEDQLFIQKVKNKNTRFIPIRLLTKADQSKVNTYEKAAGQAAKRAKMTAERLAVLAEPMPGVGILPPAVTDRHGAMLTEIGGVWQVGRNPKGQSAEDIEAQAAAYSLAKSYNKVRFDKYTEILPACAHVKGYAELVEWVEDWNAKHADNPKMQTSEKTIYRIRKQVEEEGKKSLIGKHGAKEGQTKVTIEVWQYFAALYLKEGSPSSASCWLITAGHFCTNGDFGDFPCKDLFNKLIKKRFSPGTLCFYRKGYSIWNRKYAQYIKRDITLINAGQVWVSDHAQIDIAVKSAKGTKVVFGWITSIICMKTTKTLACVYHEEPPNSDHIFEAFFQAADIFGLCEYIYILIMEKTTDVATLQAGGTMFTGSMWTNSRQRACSVLWISSRSSPSRTTHRRKLSKDGTFA